MQLLALVALFQRVDVPIVLWASVPLCVAAVYFGEARAARYVAIAVAAGCGLSATVGMLTLLHGDLSAAGGWGAIMLGGAPWMAAFHVTPLLMVLVGCIVYDRFGNPKSPHRSGV